MELKLIYVIKDGKTIESFKDVRHYEIFTLGVVNNEDKLKIKQYLNDKVHMLNVRCCETNLHNWLIYLSGYLRKYHMITQVLWEL